MSKLSLANQWSALSKSGISWDWFKLNHNIEWKGAIRHLLLYKTISEHEQKYPLRQYCLECPLQMRTTTCSWQVGCWNMEHLDKKYALRCILQREYSLKKYTTVKRSCATLYFYIFHCWWRSSKRFLWTLAAFSFIFSSVLCRTIFRGIVFSLFSQ